VLATALQGNVDRAFELFQMLNPLTHTRTPEEVGTYKVEPYVVAADVYTAPGQLGRGGWTWYTGSASWLYRVGLEGILGLRKQGDMLYVEPRAPSGWGEYSIEYRHGRARYHITVHHHPGEPRGPVSVTVDGATSRDGGIPLKDDGRDHLIEVRPLTAEISQPSQADASDGRDLLPGN
jgi:cellobiose phosphorylase